MPGFSAPNVIVQAYWGALFCLPFGFSFEALRLSTFVLGTAGVLASYLLLRELGADRRIAAVGALTLAANPIYFHLSATFMTDVPFAALLTMSLWFYVRGARRGKAGWIVWAYAVALLATLIRQFGLVLPVAFGAAYLVQNGARLRGVALAAMACVLFVAIHVGFQHWMVATGRIPRFNTPIQDIAQVDPALAFANVRLYSLQIAPYLGLFVMPLLLCLNAGSRLLRRGIGWVLAAVLLLLLVKQHAMLPGLGNILLPYGLGAFTLRDTYNLRLNLPNVPGSAPFWAVMTAFGAWGLAELILVSLGQLSRFVSSIRSADRRRQHWPNILMLVLIGSYLACVLLEGTLAAPFDRYLIPLVAPLGALLLLSLRPASTGSWQLVPACGFIALSAGLTVVGTHDYLAWNRARWHAADFLARAGIPPSKVDGGYEFEGWYLFDPDYHPVSGKSWWWTQGDDYVITSGPLEGYEKIQQFKFPTWLWPADYRVFVMRRISIGAAEKQSK